MSKRKSSRLGAQSSVIALVLAAGLVPSQAYVAEDGEAANNEIVVTVQRRSEGIEKLPISVTAFDEAKLSNLKIDLRTTCSSQLLASPTRKPPATASPPCSFAALAPAIPGRAWRQRRLLSRRCLFPDPDRIGPEHHRYSQCAGPQGAARHALWP